MADDAERIIDAQLNSRDDCLVKNFLDGFGDGYDNSANCAASCGESPKRSIPPPLLDLTPVTDESSDSICRVDLPNDLIVASPMKLSDILSILLESPEKPNATTNEIEQEDVEQGIYANHILPSTANNFPDDLRSHYCRNGGDDDGRVLRRRRFSCGDGDLSEKSLPLFRRSKSLDEIGAGQQHYFFPTSSSTNWFSSIQMHVDMAVNDLLYDETTTTTVNAAVGQHQQEQQQSGPPVVNIHGYSLPMVSVDGDSTPYVCVSDVFQTFFNSRHWDEFKSILEKNGVRSISTVASLSNDNTFGVPEIVDAIDVKQVESLLLSNQARKDGFVRCVQLSMGTTTTTTTTEATNLCSSSSSESKIIMMPERHVGELSSGIRTRHQDQSDILYVELDGRTLPSIVLNGIQYVRLVDVQKKFFSPTMDDSKQQEQQPSPTIAALAKQLEILKKACANLKIDVLKCRPNEKARMVVYANSCHSNSLHIIAAEQLPRLIEFIRCGKHRSRKKVGRPLKNPFAVRPPPPSSSSFSNGRLRLNIFDQNNSVHSDFSNGNDQLSPSSIDSGGSSSASSFTLFTAPSSPFERRQSKNAGTKRRATLDNRGGKSKRFKADQLLLLKHRDKMAPVSIWQNGHLKKYSFAGGEEDDSSSPVCYDCDEGQGSSGVNASSTPISTSDVNFLSNRGDNLALGRDDDNLFGATIPKQTVTSCQIVMDTSPPLPVVVYNRRGCRGPAGKYYDHLFVGKNAACVWCYGCGDFFNLTEFLNHTHENMPRVPDPQLFMWVSAIGEAQLDLWKSLLRKAGIYQLRDINRYDLPPNFDEKIDDQEIDSSKKESVKKIDNQKRRYREKKEEREVVVGGGPAPPPPPSFRRRQVRGDAYLDVMERYSNKEYKSPTTNCVGLNSVEHESAVDSSYAA